MVDIWTALAAEHGCTLDEIQNRHYQAPSGVAVCGAKVPNLTHWLEPLMTPGERVNFVHSVSCEKCRTVAQQMVRYVADEQCRMRSALHDRVYSHVEQILNQEAVA